MHLHNAGAALGSEAPKARRGRGVCSILSPAIYGVWGASLALHLPSTLLTPSSTYPLPPEGSGPSAAEPRPITDFGEI